MTGSSSPHELPSSRIPDFIEDQVIEILGQNDEGERKEALARLLHTVPEHAPAIRRWLETALDSEREPDRELARTLGLFEAREPEPVRIGPYRVLELIGHGGMGAVYLAEQIELLRRRVALKLIKLGMDTREVIARFEAERQALAMMNHPNIARVYDAGVTEQGRPYFVMEYVPGVSVTQYCDAHRLSLRERLDLFLKIAEAVHHAHQRGVVHRDLKPSNVLVMRLDGKPVPKIIDFGVAKATNQRLTEKTVFTQQGRVIGTPEYMSPEQAATSGLEVDARTDVYSLGVLLYELLTGELPFDRTRLRTAGLLELHRIIREEEPPRPSARVALAGAKADHAAYRRHTTTRALAKELRGALDWIVMRSMEKDPSRRYGGADDLARDVVRYLNDERVRAGPPSSIYRFRTWTRRHRGLLRLAVVSAVLVVAGWLLLREKESALQQAQQNSIQTREQLAAKQREIDEARAELARAQLLVAELERRLESSPTGVPTEVEELRRTAEQARLRAQRAETRLAEKEQQLAAAIASLSQEHAARDLIARLRSTLEAESGLGRIGDDHVAAMRTWIDGARELQSFGDELRTRLQTGSQTTETAATLEDLLARLADEDGGALARVGAQLQQALTWQQQCTVDHAEAWSAFEQRVTRAGGRYGGIRYPAAAGFVPLGPDPTSGLEELAFLPAGDLPARAADGTLQLDEASGAVFVLLPAGALDMGGSKIADWETEADAAAGRLVHPLRQVLLNAFLIGKHELTQAQWLRLSGHNPSLLQPGMAVGDRTITGRHPVEGISWPQAHEVLARWGLALPTEAQWEYAARADDYQTWWTGNDPKSLAGAANLLDRSAIEYGFAVGGTRPADNDGWPLTAPIGSFTANPFGLHDVHGNVSEWCRDWLAGYDLEVRRGDGLSQAKAGQYRVHRGGSFRDRPETARSRYRGAELPANRDVWLGVRAVR